MNSVYRTLIIFSTLTKICAGGGGQDPIADNCYNDWKGSSRIFECNDFQQMFRCVTLNGCENKGDSDFDCCLELIKNVNNLFSKNNPYVLRCTTNGILTCGIKPHTPSPTQSPTPIPTIAPTPPTSPPTSYPTSIPVTSSPSPSPRIEDDSGKSYMVIVLIVVVVSVFLLILTCICCSKTDTDTKEENLLEPDCDACGDCVGACGECV